jgi:hypothetical protein
MSELGGKDSDLLHHIEENHILWYVIECTYGLIGAYIAAKILWSCMCSESK